MYLNAMKVNTVIAMVTSETDTPTYSMISRERLTGFEMLGGAALNSMAK